ncbi:PREDICTED: uncharacterized protein LOC100634203 [Amphimedon queenslandica]|uniref:Rieske domain-containing protein n=1 Tax=Amphimedon queenslandica TaxID=400682 RepID=A0A1X7U2C8_AMPQE|nr:PREDICTED: uncharacterized protein LOC100634203 [Amphimedon queenslandica]|eukprot:XP_003389228.1 PREDICTED: uncharacterized protein LOC100634203 [Amphimedon queenslandica]
MESRSGGEGNQKQTDKESNDDNELMYFPLPPELSFNNVKDHAISQRQARDDHKIEGGNRSGEALGERRRKGSEGEGIEFELNGRQLAVFYVRNKLYCIDKKCPHAGGPLHLGDIEDWTGSKGPCIVCPWHKYCFDMSTGSILHPSSRTERLDVYPVKVDEETGVILIGFKSFHESLFSSCNF